MTPSRTEVTFPHDHTPHRSVSECASGVAALVQLEVAPVRVPLPAAVADELLAAGVHVPLVRPEVAALAEGLAADVAAVRLLARVHTHVQLEAVGVVEPLVAGATGVGPLARVRAPVRDQAALLAERLAALGAAEGPLACVGPLVDLQVD